MTAGGPWRCMTCGRIANRATRPSSHLRDGKRCGPFTDAVIAAADTSAAMRRPDTYRQSLLTAFAECPRRALLSLTVPENLTTGNVAQSADLGSAMHAIIAEILRTLYRQGATQMPTQEAIEVMYEVLAAGSWVLGPAELDDLRGLVLNFALYYEWNAGRIIALERRLTADVPCPDGKTRTITGQPDLIVADPPNGAIIVDYKSGRGRPPSPRTPVAQGEPIIGVQYLSERGHGQLDTYGLLVMRNYSAVQRVTLRELMLRYGDRREATLTRPELEHVERQLGLTAMLLDRAITEGLGSGLARPRPGAHCARRCPVARSCPVPAEQRGVGALADQAAADAEAQRYVVVDALRSAQRDAMRAYFEQTGCGLELGDGRQIRWDGGKGGAFIVTDGPPEPVPDVDVAGMLEASLRERGLRVPS